MCDIGYEKEKEIEDEGISMPGVQLWQDFGEESYKYLGTVDADRIKMEEIKENVIKAMNTWAAAAVRSTVGILEWSVNELQDIDRKTRMLRSINQALHYTQK